MELTIEQAIKAAVSEHKAGNIQEAAKYYSAIIKSQPRHPDANHNMGVIAKTLGKSEEALSFFKTALDANPKLLQFWLSFIDLLIKEGHLAEAKVYLEKAKSLGANGDAFDELEKAFIDLENANKKITDERQSDVKGNKRKGPVDPPEKQIKSIIKLQKRGQYNEVLIATKKLQLKFPNSLVLLNLIAATNIQLGNFPEAIHTYRKAIHIGPKISDLHVNLGIALKKNGNLQEAIEAYEKAISLNSKHHMAYSNMSVALKDQGQLTNALEACKKAISIKPYFPEAHNNMGNILHDLGRLEAAVTFYQNAISMSPNHASAHNNLANVFKDMGKIDDSITSYETALSINPNYAAAHRNLGFVLLNKGRLKEGLLEYEWRWKIPKNQRVSRYFRQPQWKENIILEGKKILVWSEQGVGDTINWSSCIPILAAQAEQCILECPQKLVSLLSRSFPNAIVKNENRKLDQSRDDFDVHIPMGSLYKELLPVISNRSRPMQFLKADPDRVKFWRNRLNALGAGTYVGVCWKSSNMSAGRKNNYAPIEEWRPLLSRSDLIFVNLQYQDFINDLEMIEREFGTVVNNFQDIDLLNDLDDVAALMTALDFVVSTTCAVPLLAAGLGIKTKLASWQQSPWNNTLFNPVGPLVDIYYKNTWESWKPTFQSIANDII